MYDYISLFMYVLHDRGGQREYHTTGKFDGKKVDEFKESVRIHYHLICQTLSSLNKHLVSCSISLQHLICQS